MSKVLILTTCSNHKLESAEVIEYRTAWRVSEFLPEDLAIHLYKTRSEIYKLITSDKVARNGVPLRDMPYNSNLVDGTDFRGRVRRGLYLPALQRYDGRFYKELGTSETRASLSRKIKHHLLIVSGLYGLLTPTELIQCYSCHVTDHPAIARYWIEEPRTDLLTSLLLSYIEKHGIVKVFDFMAVDSYRNLLSWSTIRHAMGNNVLHCYSKPFAGPDLLPSLGILARKFLTEMSETDLLKLKAEDSIKIPNDAITFLPFPVPHPPLAREIHEQASIASAADKIGRMRRNILRLLDIAVRQKKHAGFGERITKLETRGHKKDVKTTKLVRQFGKIRDAIEYNNSIPSDSNWRDIYKTYEDILKWAQDHGYLEKVKAWEEVEY